MCTRSSRRHCEVRPGESCLQRCVSLCPPKFRECLCSSKYPTLCSSVPAVSLWFKYTNVVLLCVAVSLWFNIGHTPKTSKADTFQYPPQDRERQLYSFLEAFTLPSLAFSPAPGWDNSRCTAKDSEFSGFYTGYVCFLSRPDATKSRDKSTLPAHGGIMTTVKAGVFFIRCLRALFLPSTGLSHRSAILSG